MLKKPDWYLAGEYPLMAGDTNNIVNWTSLVNTSFPTLRPGHILMSLWRICYQFVQSGCESH